MTLTNKERLRKAIHHKPVDRIPTQINYTHSMARKLAAHFSVSLEELPTRVDNHMVRANISYPRRFSDDGQVVFDWWGVGWSTKEEGYFPLVSPLAESRDLDEVNWPNPHDPELLHEAAQIIEADGDQHFIVPNFSFCLFERAWSLRGFEAFLMDMALDIGFVEKLLDRITETQLVLIRRFLKLGIDGAYFGDDYGAQVNLLFSPKNWRELIKPRLARMFAPFREAGLPIIMHSDGNIADILPDLVEIGLAVYNPAQPEVVDHIRLRETFGEQLAYYGGVSTQTVLPYGTPDEVRAAVEACARALAPDGTGLLIAPSHRMMTDIPMENVKALLDAFSTLEG